MLYVIIDKDLKKIEGKMGNFYVVTSNSELFMECVDRKDIISLWIRDITDWRECMIETIEYFDLREDILFFCEEGEIWIEKKNIKKLYSK